MYRDYKSNKIKIPVLLEREGEFDLSKLDFKPIGVEVVEINSMEFVRFFIKHSKKNKKHDFFDYNTRSFRSILDKSYDGIPYVCIPDDKLEIQDNYDDLNYQLQLPYQILQILSPSRLFIKARVDFELIERNILHDQGSTTVYSDRSYAKYPVEKIKIRSLKQSNKLIASFQNRKEDPLLKNCLDHFMSNFDISHYTMQFLSLITSLESLVEGGTELSYRLKRLIAIISGDTPKTAQNIFKNLSSCYSLRSKFTHGEKYDISKFHKYLPYLIFLTSRTIIELLSHDTISRKDLNKKATQLGFGNQNELTKNYTKLYPNKTFTNKLLQIELT